MRFLTLLRRLKTIANVPNNWWVSCYQQGTKKLDCISYPDYTCSISERHKNVELAHGMKKSTYHLDQLLSAVIVEHQSITTHDEKIVAFFCYHAGHLI